MGSVSQVKSLDQLGLTAIGGKKAKVTGLAVDSRDVKTGFLFAALPGSKVHGGEFITYAVRMGASAILTDTEGAKIAEDELAEAIVDGMIDRSQRGEYDLDRFILNYA